MGRRRFSMAGCAFLAVLTLALSGPMTGAGRRQTASPADAAEQSAVLDQYGTTCHNQTSNTGNLSLEGLDLARVSEDADVWERVIRKLRTRMMPPVGLPRPDEDAYDRLVTWLEDEIDTAAALHVPPPGVHRLNRAEYENAVRDLIDFEVDASQFLPPDDSSYGFDNMAGTLGLSPALLEAYVSAAGKISRLAIGNVTAPTQTLYPIPADTTQNYHVEGLPFGTRGGALIEHYFPVDGEYAINVYTVKRGNMGGSGAFGDVDGEQLEVSMDGVRLGLFDWDEGVASERGSGTPGTIEVAFPAKAGMHTIGVTFLATHFAPLDDHNQQFERTTIETGGIDGFTFYPHVGSVRIDGPFNAVGVEDSAARQKIFTCRPAGPSQEAACAEEIISSLARRAYRRPVTSADIATLMDFYEGGRVDGAFDSGIEMALRRILADPEFLTRIEYPPATAATGELYPIGDLDLASRLSFFLWSSIPDDELLDIAVQGRLREPGVLEAQVRRMLADPKSQALVENFAGQWLELRNLQASAPVVMTFPDFDDNLRQAFWRETELLFDSIVREDRSVLDLLTADYTFVNERLAKHYGLPGVRGSYFRRVQLGPEFDARRGLLGKGAILTISSQPGRTSPVQRGKWVMENLLGVSPPDPPPNVPDLPERKNDVAGNAPDLTMRQKMIDHRVRPDCVQCHRLMDPIGFSLENFDAIGMWRTHEGEAAIDSADVVYDGARVEGVVGLRNWLVEYSDEYLLNVTENLLTYALGRGVEYFDMPVVRSIKREAAGDDYRFSSLVLGVVNSAPFQSNMKVRDSEE